MTASRRLLLALVALLALTPLLLHGYIGLHSRLLTDDYCSIVQGQALGAWGMMQQFYHSWSGSYAAWFAVGLLAPLDALLAQLLPAAIIAIWLAGACWLIWQGLDMLGAALPRRAAALTLAALLTAAWLNALVSPLSFFWLTTGFRYNLAVALFPLCAALALYTARRFQSSATTALRLCVLAALCFVCAGFAEIQVVFQLGFFLLCALAAAGLLRVDARRAALAVLAVAFAASLCSLFIQVTAPGTAARNAYVLSVTVLDRSALHLLTETIETIFVLMARPHLLVSVILAMALGGLATLYRGGARAEESSPASGSRLRAPAAALWLLLAVQILWLPLLWSHTSDYGQALGRFSWRYMSVIGLNLAGMLALCAALWRRGPLNAWLARRFAPTRLRALMIAALFIMLILVPPLPIDRLAAAYLFTSCAALLICALGMPADSRGNAARRHGWLAFAAWAAAWCIAGATIGMGIYGLGSPRFHALPVATTVVVASGLAWGAYMGCGIKRAGWSDRARVIALLVILLCSIFILTRQAALLATYRSVAAQWDASRERIVSLREAGVLDVEIEPLTQGPFTELDGCSAAYFGVRTLTVRGK